jgi:hypothetical protein
MPQQAWMNTRHRQDRSSRYGCHLHSLPNQSILGRRKRDFDQYGRESGHGARAIGVNPMRADFEASSTGITWTQAFHPAEELNADQFVVATLKPHWHLVVVGVGTTSCGIPTAPGNQLFL